MSAKITSINYCPVKSVSFQSIENCKIKKDIGIIGDRIFAFAKDLDLEQAKLFEKSPADRKGKWNKVLTLKNSPALNKYNFISKDDKLTLTLKDKAKEIRNEIELIEKEIPGELDKSGRYNAHLISPLLDEVTHNPKILDAVQSLIGENILVCGTTLFIKNPNEKGFVSYHQDAKYIEIGRAHV